MFELFVSLMYKSCYRLKLDLYLPNGVSQSVKQCPSVILILLFSPIFINEYIITTPTFKRTAGNPNKIDVQIKTTSKNFVHFCTTRAIVCIRKTSLFVV